MVAIFTKIRLSAASISGCASMGRGVCLVEQQTYDLLLSLASPRKTARSIDNTQSGRMVKVWEFMGVDVWEKNAHPACRAQQYNRIWYKITFLPATAPSA